MLSHAITIHMSTNNLNLQHQLYYIYIYIILYYIKNWTIKSNHKSTHKLP